MIVSHIAQTERPQEHIYIPAGALCRCNILLRSNEPRNKSTGKVNVNCICET